jgi:hypothetical protein
VDPNQQSSIREVVDGQQRIRAIVDFASNKLSLTKRSERFRGHKYSDLEDEDKQRFLGYTLTIEQLLNASDDDVIDMFARLNSYTVTLNAAERRHARFQTEFKFAVRKASQDLRWFIEKYGVFTLRQRFRMADDAFCAELFGLVLNGVTDGGEAKIGKLYSNTGDEVFSDEVHEGVRTRIDEALSYIDSNFGAIIEGPLSRHYQLLMIVGAYLYHKYGLPQGDLIKEGELDSLPSRRRLERKEVVVAALTELIDALESEHPEERFRRFVDAASSTHRIASRRVRFLEYVRILGCDE